MASFDPNEFSEVSIPVPWGHLAGRWYGAAGRAGVRPVLALHGWQDNCGTFALLAPLLAPHASLLCIDFPGHGHSSHLPAGIPYHTMDFVRTILHVMHAFGWERVSLLSHSMGSHIAYYFAGIYPQRVDMIISIEVIRYPHSSSAVQTQLLRYFTERMIVDSERHAQQTPSPAKHEPPTYTFAECERLLHEGSERSVELAQCHHLLARNLVPSRQLPHQFYFGRDNRVKHIVLYFDDRRQTELLVRRFSAVPVPYLLVCGGLSTDPSSGILPDAKEVLELLATNNPLFEMHVVPGGSHHVHLNDAPAVADIVIPFLRKHRPLETPTPSPVKAKM